MVLFRLLDPDSEMTGITSVLRTAHRQSDGAINANHPQR